MAASPGASSRNPTTFPSTASSNFYFFGLAFAGFAWSTQTPNLVVAAVSESAEAANVAANLAETAGDKQLSVMGLYYSTDAGQTWYLATITDGPGQIIQTTQVPIGGGGNAATAVVWNPVRKRFYAAVRFHGYYESLDGVTWTRLANQPGVGLTTTECPANPYGTGSVACPIFRGALAVQPATGDLFALTVDINLLDQGLWQDLCAATSGACASSTVTFAQQLSTAALDNGAGAIPSGDYNLALAAVPAAGRHASLCRRHRHLSLQPRRRLQFSQHYQYRDLRGRPGRALSARLRHDLRREPLVDLLRQR